MAFLWRKYGVNYVKYSQIAARVLRRCLRSELRADAMKRDMSIVYVATWKEGEVVSDEDPRKKGKLN